MKKSKLFALLGILVVLVGLLYAGPSILQIYMGGTGQSSFSAGILRSSGSALSSSELSGDGTTSGSNALTLTSVVTAGSCGDTTHSCGLTYDAKGRITAATNNVISGGGGGGGTSGFFGLWTFTAPPSTGWSWDNQGSSTTDSTSGYEYASLLPANAVQARVRYRTAPATPYTITAGFLYDVTGAPSRNGAAASAGLMLGFRDVSGKLVTLRVTIDGQSAVNTVWDRWNSTSSFNSSTVTYGDAANVNLWLARQPILMQISDDGTNLTGRLSVDGNHWKQFFQESRTAFLSSPANVLYGAYANQDQVEIAVIHWAVTSP